MLLKYEIAEKKKFSSVLQEHDNYTKVQHIEIIRKDFKATPLL